MGLLDRLRPGRGSADPDGAAGAVLFTAQRPPLLESDHRDDDEAPEASAPAPSPEPRSIIDHPAPADDPVVSSSGEAAGLLSAIAADTSPPPAPPRRAAAAQDRPAPPPAPRREPPEVEWSKAEHDEPDLFEAPAEPAPESDDLLDHFAGLLDGMDMSDDGKAA